MREFLIGDIFTGFSRRSSVNDRSYFLTEYAERAARKNANTLIKPTIWAGHGLEGPELRSFILGLSTEIDLTWGIENAKTKGKPLDISAYTRVAILAERVALNVLAKAREMSASDDPEIKNVGNNILFHRYLNSAINAVNLVRGRNPDVVFDPQPVLERAIQITLEEMLEFSTVRTAAQRIHSAVQLATEMHFSDLTGLPASYFSTSTDKKRIDDESSVPASERAALLQRMEKDELPVQGLLITALNELQDNQFGRKYLKSQKLPGAIEDVFADAECLKPGEKRVLQLRFGLEDGKQRTLEEVSGKIGVTRERIRQIEFEALKKLRVKSRMGALNEYVPEEHEKPGVETYLNGAINASTQKDLKRALENIENAKEVLLIKYGVKGYEKLHNSPIVTWEDRALMRDIERIARTLIIQKCNSNVQSRI